MSSSARTGPPAPRTVREHEVFNGGAISAALGRSSQDQSAHTHDFLEIEVIGGGSGYHVTAAGRRPANTGDVFVLRPGTWHGYDECDELLIANVYVAPAALSGDAAVLHSIPALRDLLWLRPAAVGRHGVYAAHIPEAGAAEMVQQVATLQNDASERRDNYPLLLGRLLTTLGTLTEHLAEDSTQRVFHPAVGAAVARLENTPEHPWCLDDLAAAVNLDPTYLSRLFRRHLGLPPMAYLARVRAERATALLTRGDEPVADIGACVGWPNPAHFTRRFHALVGMTPTEYRRRHASL